MRVVLHEHQRFLREALATALAARPELVVVGVASSADELLRLCGEIGPDAALVDLDADGGLEAAKRLAGDEDGPRVVGLHSPAVPEGAQVPTAEPAAGPGWATATDADGFRGILVALLPAGSTVTGTAAPTVGGPGVAADEELTSREKQVMQYIAAGRGTKEIADSLGISPKTVDRHKQNVFRKLGVQNQAHAVAVSIRSGILPAEHGAVGGTDE